MGISTENTDIKNEEKEAGEINIEELDSITDNVTSENNVNSIKKKKHKIWQNQDNEVKLTVKRILAYFIIYSFLGFIVETIYGMLTKGVIESRQGCLYGPFCCIYGLGAAVMIPGLQKFKKSNWGLFIAGAIEGSIVEYVISWVGEMVFQIKWWDYSNLPFNINGRICIIFAIFWGLLALVLMRFINPYIDKIIDKTPKKVFNIATISLTIFLIFDLLITSFGLKVFHTRLVKEHNLEIKANSSLILNEDILEDEVIKVLSDKIFTDEKMLKTFPNIKFEDKDGNIIWVKDILTDIQPYYFKISDRFRLK